MLMDEYKIIAVDFDGTLNLSTYPDVGNANRDLFAQLIMERSKGNKVILYTCRVGQPLKNAIDFCRNNGLEFDAVNMNLLEVIEKYGGHPRKIAADIYIDDQAIKPDDYIQEGNKKTSSALSDSPNI